MIKKLKNWLQSLEYYVIADPEDNSITLSKRLFKHIQNHAEEGDAAKVFVFQVSEDEESVTGSVKYGFMVNPDINKPTQMCDIQYNSEHKCIGFETLCPSVNRIFYEYGLPSNCPIKLSISIRKAQDKVFYQIEKPDEKLIRKYKEA